MQEKEFMDARTAAEYLGITYGALRNMTYRREIPFQKLGRRLRFKTEEIRNHLMSTRIGLKEWR